MSRRNLFLLIAAILISAVCHDRNTQNPHARYVAEGYEAIDGLALDRPSEQELVAGAMRGMVDVLRQRGDEHSRYFRPRAAQLFREDISGDFGGVGVRIRLLGDPPQLTIVGPPEPGTPAFYGGVKPDDRIVAIDGHSTAKLTMSDVLDHMRGKVGEPVTLSILRGKEDEAVTIRLERAVIQVPSVLGDRRLSDGSWQHLLEQDQRVALVRISTFGDKTVDELEQLLPALREAGAKALVIDLRNNSGGALDAAVAACNFFLPPNKLIVETRGRKGNVLEQYESWGGPYTDLPLTVLINGGSASASEIMAACLQDHGRTVIVGERSYGKGTVQQLLYMESGSSMLKLTTASFWRPSGVDIHRRPGTDEASPWGVLPDEGYDVPLDDETFLAFAKARSERDLMPVDQVDPDESALESPTETRDSDAVDDSGEEQVEETGDHKSQDPDASGAVEEAADEETPFVDSVLDRAVEYLQSLLDGSASLKLRPVYAG